MVNELSYSFLLSALQFLNHRLLFATPTYATSFCTCEQRYLALNAPLQRYQRGTAVLFCVFSAPKVPSLSDCTWEGAASRSRISVPFMESV
jgi:hypothetical protein